MIAWIVLFDVHFFQVDNRLVTDNIICVGQIDERPFGDGFGYGNLTFQDDVGLWTVDSNGEWAADDAPETVIPNPQGTPTVDLSTVQIGNTIYDIVSGNEVIELTQAEWDALPSSKLTDGIIYVITDGSGGGGGSDNHAIHVPPVIYENGVLKKIANFNLLFIIRMLKYKYGWKSNNSS